MRERIQRFALALMLMAGVLFSAVAPANAINVFDKACTAETASTTVCKSKDEATNTLVQDIIQLLLFAVGIISVIMIIVGGLRYVLSNGDSAKITSAKNTILYAVVGLVVALLAYAIVYFVVGSVTPTP